MTYEEIRNQLKQRQTELASQKVNINKRMLRTGMQGRPQRQNIGVFNKQLFNQSNEYGKQINDIDRFLLGESNKNNIISSLSEGEEMPIFPNNPEPNISFFGSPNLNKVRNRFKKGGLWF